MSEVPKDRNGNSITLGAKVRLLEVEDDFLDSLDREEREYIKSMINEVFEVYEIDEYGQPWIEKEWQIGEGRTISHSLSLRPNQMVLC